MILLQSQDCDHPGSGCAREADRARIGGIALVSVIVLLAALNLIGAAA